ncbi:nitrogen fixation protein FixH [Caulobacter ginsengisoli]|uniref:Nitrogen fixation protein FixH n=1 Tax=Caulobacter ginsengisoli TaxID=400775 RepID=A0ABU0IVD8_9CAUL|nr:FixH family protein [Caulobacter ginsengisoli]MDQ0465964.1 nitrogen fixation protein FixH [Caulobacter ginsengisoli]
MTQSLSQPGFRIKGWHVLAGVVAFFMVVIAVDAGFLVMAYRTYPGQVSRTPYEDGTAYNNKLAQLAAQAKLGWTVAAGVAPDGQLLVQVRDRAGAPVSGLTGQARLERPATEAGRITPRFREAAPGDYLASPGRLIGAWDLTVALTDKAGHRFEAERRLTWP